MVNNIIFKLQYLLQVKGNHWFTFYLEHHTCTVLHEQEELPTLIFFFFLFFAKKWSPFLEFCPLSYIKYK